MNLDKKYILLIFAGLLFLVAIPVYQYNVLEPGDRLFQDYMYRNHMITPEDHQIIMIAIDEQSLAYFAHQRVYWPWPREFYGIVIDYLTQHGAEVIALDLLLDTPDFDRLSYRADLSDERFAQSVQEAGNVILGLNTGIYASELSPADIEVSTHTPLEVNNCAFPDTYTIVTQPIPRFLEAAKFAGDTQIGTGRDGLIRDVPLLIYADQIGYIPSLSFAALLTGFDGIPEISCKNGFLTVDTYTIPIDRNGNMQLKWYGKGGAEDGVFTYYSFQRVMRDALGYFRNDTAELIISPDIFEGKNIIIGANAAGLADIKNTPVSSLASFPGMEIHATALQNILNGSHVVLLDVRKSWTLLMFIILGSVFIFGYRGTVESTIYLLVFSSIIAMIAGYVFMHQHVMVPFTLLLITGALSYTGVMALNYVTEGKEKKKINRAFSHYVQPEIVREMISDPKKLRLGGDKKNVTIMFTDLAGFSSVSEELKPEALIVFLIYYFGKLSDIIIKEKGTIDKYIGDSIMAFWGAPLPNQFSAKQACRAALEMQSVIPDIQKKFAGLMDYDPITRIGINSGEAVVGNIGSEIRFDYTVLGHHVNLASRLEPLNKQFGTKIIISEFTYQQLPENFLCRQLDLVRVTGIQKPVKVYELIAELSNENQSEEQVVIIQRFEEGLRLYRNREWDKAISLFNEILSIANTDGPSRLYLQRCQLYKKIPPPADWDGIFEPKTK